MPLKVGDRVVPKKDNTYSVGKHNIGTITEINEENGFYVIAWDHPGQDTYETLANKNQWNMGYWGVELYIDDGDTMSIRNHPNYEVIVKVKQMNRKRKELGYAI